MTDREAGMLLDVLKKKEKESLVNIGAENAQKFTGDSSLRNWITSSLQFRLLL